EQANIADKTLIVLSADHYPYGLTSEQINELAGHKTEETFEIYESTLIIYAKGVKAQTIDKPCSGIDIIPTVSNLLGLEYDSRLLMGTDIFSDSPPLVIFADRSFITDIGRYNARRLEFIANEGVIPEDGYRNGISQIIDAKFAASAKILELDYYSLLRQFL
ncbi:MAG: LTA synthase family protein, partial [Oscillospiraceae bacterium]|nr:LTA synthase family protein [Oscillospiraceae bacterium]